MYMLLNACPERVQRILLKIYDYYMRAYIEKKLQLSGMFNNKSNGNK